MTEQPGQTDGGFYGDPQAQPPPPAGISPRSTNPLLGLYPPAPSADYPEARGKGSAVLKVTGLLLLAGVAAGIAYMALSGATLLMPRSAAARAEAMAKNERAVSHAQAQVQLVRAQMMLYRLQHNDRLPTLAQLQDGWGVLVRETYADGKLAAESAPPRRGDRRSTAYGPYLNQLPLNPLTNSSRVAAAGKATADDGFTYDPRTGKVWAVTTANTDEVRRAGAFFELVR